MSVILVPNKSWKRRWTMRCLQFLVVGSSAAGSVRVRFLDIDFHLFLSGWIGLIVITIESERVLRRCKESGQVPARGALVEPLVGQIGILRPWTDQVATKDIHNMGTYID